MGFRNTYQNLEPEAAPQADIRGAISQSRRWRNPAPSSDQQSYAH